MGQGVPITNIAKTDDSYSSALNAGGTDTDYYSHQYVLQTNFQIYFSNTNYYWPMTLTVGKLSSGSLLYAQPGINQNLKSTNETQGFTGAVGNHQAFRIHYTTTQGNSSPTNFDLFTVDASNTKLYLDVDDNGNFIVTASPTNAEPWHFETVTNSGWKLYHTIQQKYVVTDTGNPNAVKCVLGTSSPLVWTLCRFN